MARLLQGSLNDGVRAREVLGWAMYDFANSGYTTVVLTAVFNAYFVGVVARGAEWGTFAWTLTLAVSNASVMAIVPWLGRRADARSEKKRLLAWSTAGCVAATVALAAVGPGDLVLAAFALVASNLFYAFGESLIAAFLPELARRQAMGRVSGWGWSFGYFGGMLTLGLSLGYVLWAQSKGLPATHFVPVTMLITAAVYAIASCFTFALMRERGGRSPAIVEPSGWWKGFQQRLGQTRDYPAFRRLLWCAVWYQAGISVVIALAAVYAEQVLGFRQAETMMLIFLVNIAAAAGAFAFGYVQDAIGHRRALATALWGWLLMVALAAAATTPQVFWVAAVVAGLCMGSSQSAGRAIAALLAPPARSAEFFGLWTFAVRLSTIVGPLAYGLVTLLTHNNHRVAIACTGLFFVAGLWVLRGIDIDAGAAHALRSGAAATPPMAPV